MRSMGYCRFQNAVKDMIEYKEHLHDDLSEDENKARERFISLCEDIYKEALDFEKTE